MATAAWSRFYPLILPNVPNCPTITVDQELAAVSADFCARTHLWRDSLEPQNTTVDEALYDVDDFAVLESVLWILVDGEKLAHTDPRHMRQEDFERKGKPTHFWVVADRSIRLFPIPDDVYEIKGEVALKPSRTSTGVEDWIYQTWADAIVSGVLWKLCSIVGKEWSNIDFAMMHKGIYERAITQARIRDYRNVPLSVSMRPFA
jgi:hypothetical protein